MQLRRYISQEGLPSRAPTSPVDFQRFDASGEGMRKMGAALTSVGEHLYQADAPERAQLRQQEAHRLKLEEDLATQEAITSYKTRAQEVLERRRTEYSPGTSDDEKSITDFAKNTVQELKDLVDLEAFSNLDGNARLRFRTEAFKHIDATIPELNRMRTDILVSKSEARIGTSKALHEHKANAAKTESDAIDAMGGYANDLQIAVDGRALSADKAVERANKFNEQAALSWFNNQIAKDPEALFQAMHAPNEEQAFLFGFINGKDAKGFSEEHQRQALDSIERKRKGDERALEEKQNAIENDFWDSYFRSPKASMYYLDSTQNEELKKLKPERYKAIVKDLAEYRDAGGPGNERMMNYWKMRLFHNSNELSADAIAGMNDLNWKQRQELYAAKRTQASFEESAANNEKHWSNDPNYKFYSHELQDQLGIIKISPFTNASSLQLLSQAEIAYRNEYERLHKERKGAVTQEDASELMKRIVTTTRQNLGFKAQVYGEIPRFTDVNDLNAARESGRITDAEFTREFQKLKAWRDLQGPDGQQAGSASGMSPKKDFKKHGKE